MCLQWSCWDSITEWMSDIAHNEWLWDWICDCGCGEPTEPQCLRRLRGSIVVFNIFHMLLAVVLLTTFSYAEHKIKELATPPGELHVYIALGIFTSLVAILNAGCGVYGGCFWTNVMVILWHVLMLIVELILNAAALLSLNHQKENPQDPTKPQKVLTPCTNCTATSLTTLATTVAPLPSLATNQATTYLLVAITIVQILLVGITIQWALEHHRLQRSVDPDDEQGRLIAHFEPAPNEPVIEIMAVAHI